MANYFNNAGLSQEDQEEEDQENDEDIVGNDASINSVLLESNFSLKTNY